MEWGRSASVTNFGAGTLSQHPGISKSASKERPSGRLKMHQMPLFHKTIPSMSLLNLQVLPQLHLHLAPPLPKGVQPFRGHRDPLLQREAREERPPYSRQHLGSGSREAGSACPEPEDLEKEKYT